MAYVMPEGRRFGLPATSYFGLFANVYRKFRFDISILEKTL